MKSDTSLSLYAASAVVRFVCMCRRLMSHLLENHELIQEVNTLAGEEFPNGLLSLEALRVRVGAHLGGLVLQEIRQRVVLQAEGEITVAHCQTLVMIVTGPLKSSRRLPPTASRSF